MCFFKKPVKPVELIIPHPEQPPDYTKTMENTIYEDVLRQWFEEYKVPEKHQPYWYDKIVAEITMSIMYPAGTWEENGVRHLAVRPEWLNPGVIAHEQAHNSYALLNEDQKNSFTFLFTYLKDTDPLIKFLFSKNSYGLQNVVEGHAEVYRYLGEQMPLALKQYYPNLY